MKIIQHFCNAVVLTGLIVLIGLCGGADAGLLTIKQFVFRAALSVVCIGAAVAISKRIEGQAYED